MTKPRWSEELARGDWIFRPPSVPASFLVAFSGRGAAPEGTASPTAYLARSFARALSLDDIPIVYATQVHGKRATLIRETPPPGAAQDAGRCDVVATDLAGVALAVQAADCVSTVITGSRSIAVVHAGWRGSAQNAAAAGVGALEELGEDPSSLSAFLGPSIGPCCYDVNEGIAALFGERFLNRTDRGHLLLDLPAVNCSQLEAAGIPAENISGHPACTRCCGGRFASYRRDGAASGRMIAIAARLGGYCL